MASYLKLRGDSWYVQRKVPRHLERIIGKSIIVRSLGTTDRKAAESRRHAVLAQIEDEFQAAASILTDHPSSPAWAQRIARELRGAVERGELDEESAHDLMHDTVDRHLSAAGITREQATDIHAMTLRAASDMVTHTDVMPLSQAVTAYLSEKEGRVQESTVAAKKRVLAEFSEWLRADLNVAAIGRQHAGRYVTHLLTKGRAPKTNRDAVSTLSTFFGWATRKGFYEAANPWTGQGADLKGSRRGTSSTGKRRPWSPEELGKLAGSLSPEDIRWQTCVIALYTGMRPNEIAHTETTDVNLKDGFIVIPEGKTESSVRQVPIHPTIEPLIKRLAEDSKEGFLLPGLKPGGADKKRGHGISKRIGRHIRVGLGIEDRGVVFHSLRSAFIHACETAGIPESSTKLLVGHSRQAMSYGTYSPGPGLPALQEAMKRVSFGEIDQIITRRTS
ncbi:MAG TPA: DUF6538 domain-containing protein [Gammaproteobacteria bacterium]|nr:DUF6538 domain-containing protein [Gammaproteobacteria bacterium]